MLQSPVVKALNTAPTLLAFPAERPMRDRIRAICCDLVASWKASGGLPAAVKTRRGLEEQAEQVCRRAGIGPEHAGWTMVAIVSEFWRDRLAAPSNGSRVVLLPDCADGKRSAAGTPAVCGPACEVATLWSAARDSGWTVLPTSDALSAIGGLLTGQYQGILGLAELEDLQKAFARLPCFAVPIAAVPVRSPFSERGGSGSGDSPGRCGCPASVDLETALGFLGVAGGGRVPVADYLPVLREAAALFQADALAGLLEDFGVDERDRGVARAAASAVAAPLQGVSSSVDPLDAAAMLSYEFLGLGGKFLRPFICLAAHDAVLADRAAANPPFPPSPRASARGAAVAIEIFHKASLVHDDIEDDDAMRYGRPTMHRVHGIPAAINAGDYLLGLGYKIMSGVGGSGDSRDPALVADLLGILSDAHMRLARGQGAELWWRDAADKRLSPGQSLAIYGLKTSPAFEAAITMGVRLGGCRPADVGAIDRYALHVGTAFQILNDLKDWSGDAENSRVAAGDLLGGRPTVLLALALERLDASAADQLLGLAARRRGQEAKDADDGIARASALFERADVFNRALGLVEQERRLAVAAIATCRLPRLREVMEFLLDLAVPQPAS